MKIILLAALLTVAPPPSTQKAIDAYLAQLASIESSATPVSLEPLLGAADEVQTQVMAIDNEQAWIEKLSDADFEALQGELRGLSVHRGLDVYAQPDPDFLLALAEAHGRPADADFFRIYRQHWSKDLVPVFVSLDQRASTCVRFGEGIIPEIYEAWRGYVASHPGAYTGFSVQAINDLEEAVALGTCACGDQNSVVAEERGFLRRFPDTRVAGQIRARIKQLHDDPDQRPVHCQ